MFTALIVVTTMMATFASVHFAMCHPLLVACDRVVSRRHLHASVVSPTDNTALSHEIAAAVLQSVASRVRSGVPVVEALDDECSQAHVDREALDALIGSDTRRATTPAELEQRASNLRAMQLLDNDVRVHTSQARASARLLTVAPITFLLVLLVGSNSLRARLVHSPTLIVAVGVGLVLNHAARRWMSRLITDATRVDADDDAITDIHSRISIALTAGHTISDALIITHNESETHARELLEQPVRLIAAGGSLAEALTMVGGDPRLRSLSRVLADSQRHGTPVALVAEQLMSTAHHLRRNVINERINRLPVRLAAPLIAGVLPAFILLAVLPLIAATMGSFNVMRSAT